MGVNPGPSATMDEPRRALRAATGRAASGRAIIRASSEGFLFREVCRAMVEAGYGACAIHENDPDSGTSAQVASSGAAVAGAIALFEPPADGTDSRRRPAPGRVEGDPENAAVERFLVRPAGGRILLLSVYSYDGDFIEGEELRQLRELARDLVAGIDNLSARTSAGPKGGRRILGTRGPGRSPSTIEAALREQLEMIRSIADSIQDALVMIDGRGKISYWNPAAEQTFGWTADEALGRPLHPMLSPERFHDANADAFRHFVATGEGAAIGNVVELSGMRKDGSEFPLELSLGRVRVRGTWQAVGLVRDITERKDAFEDLKKAMIEAEAAAEAKSLFLANVSHEIRTPLNAVIGMAGLLLGTDLDAEQRDFTRIIHRSGEILLSVINDILDYSKMDAEALEFETIPFSVRSCVEDVGDLLAQKAAETGLELVILIDHRVPRRVAGDPGRLRQVLTNLINNAIKFTETGEVLLRVSPVDSDDGRHRIGFVVEDTGIGIPADRLGALFQPFTQVDASTTRRYGGTGLGLSISKSLVERMGGVLEVESQEGRGTVFRFEAVFETAPAEENPPPVLHGTLDEMTVLIVDDNRTNRRLLEELLGRWGCVTRSAASGQEALDLLLDPESTEDFDLAILDYSMPSMNGATLAQAIRTDSKLTTMPLILLTSMPEFGDGKKMKEIGFNAYLTKPVKQSNLYDAILSVTTQPDPSAITENPPMVTRHTLNEARRSRLRILVAEDNAVNQKVTSRMLERLGYRCDLAEDGQAALDALETHAYDLIFMDCQMPVMDGFEATRRIRETEGEQRRITIIATTADALAGTRESCLQAGMDDYISKPIDIKKLAEVLERFGGSSTAGNDTAAVAEEKAPVEISRLQNISSGDHEFERRILFLYLEEYEKRIANIKVALAQADFEEVRGDAHSIKGSAGNIGADLVAEAAGQLQRAAEDRDGDLCAEIHEILTNEGESTNRWLNAYIRELEAHED